MGEVEFKRKIEEILARSERFYFPSGTDQEIKNMMIAYIESHEFMYKLTDNISDFKINHAAQKGFTVSNRSIIFRVLLDYKGKKGQIAMNFPNWRGWEQVLPLNAKNIFKVKGFKNREPKKNGRYEHGYYYSFLFKDTREFVEFFNKYVATHAVY